jgi:hypothetical protein
MIYSIIESTVGILGAKKEEVIGDWSTVHRDELHNVYS